MMCVTNVLDKLDYAILGQKPAQVSTSWYAQLLLHPPLCYIALLLSPACSFSNLKNGTPTSFTVSQTRSPSVCLGATSRNQRLVAKRTVSPITQADFCAIQPATCRLSTICMSEYTMRWSQLRTGCLHVAAISEGIG